METRELDDQDHYDALDIRPDASSIQIKAAFRYLALRCRPDKPGADAPVLEQWYAIDKAYAVLTDPEARRRYDMRRISNLLRYRKPKNLGRDVASDGTSSPTPQYQPRPPNKRHEPGMIVLEGTLNGRPVKAIPDTGAQTNVISRSAAHDFGLAIVEHKGEEDGIFTLPNGKEIKTLGVVLASWTFWSEPLVVFDQVLSVLEECIFDVLIGSPFLRLTSTMSTNRSRLSRIPRPMGLRVRCVNLVGRPSHRVRGYLDGTPVAALPDSGSEPNLISYSYATQRGWRIHSSSLSRNLIMFADGSSDETAGELTLPWVFDQDNRLPQQDVTFSVLHGCTFDVILGQDFLDDTDAFVAHSEYFVDVTDSMQGLNHVIWARKKSREKRSDGVERGSLARNSSGHIGDLEHQAARDRELRRTLNPTPELPRDSSSALSGRKESSRARSAQSASGTTQTALTGQQDELNITEGPLMSDDHTAPSKSIIHDPFTTWRPPPPPLSNSSTKSRYGIATPARKLSVHPGRTLPNPRR
ncbi:MAG: hypothetical protein M1828_001668 [Chrysothrix sp. TS-e1954]|nr:MAG: hypothetical protein M1828_001668 [Chrysothrix sp. TS-e1954]